MGGVNDLVVCHPLNARKKRTSHLPDHCPDFPVSSWAYQPSKPFPSLPRPPDLPWCRPAIPHLGRSPGAVAGEGRIRRSGEAQAPAAVQRALCTLRGPEPGAMVYQGPREHLQLVNGWLTQPQPPKKTLYRLYMCTVDVDVLLLALILWCGQIFGQLMSYIDASHQPETMIFHHRFGALCCNSMTQYDEPVAFWGNHGQSQTKTYQFLHVRISYWKMTRANTNTQYNSPHLQIVSVFIQLHFIPCIDCKNSVKSSYIFEFLTIIYKYLYINHIYSHHHLHQAAPSRALGIRPSAAPLFAALHRPLAPGEARRVRRRPRRLSCSGPGPSRRAPHLRIFF